MCRVLVVEDHQVTRRTIVLYLQREGFEVDSADDGLAGWAMALQGGYDLLLVDLMLPGLDGREFCRRARRELEVPLIMLTALSTEDDIVHGLGLGASDYITKPFSPRELVARVRARLRERATSADAPLQIADLCLDLQRKELRRDNQPVRLTATEFRLLAVLMQSAGRALSRDQLIERAFGFDFEGSSKNVDIHISRLRKAIEPDRLNPRYILTVAGHGYRFCSRTEHGHP